MPVIYFDNFRGFEKTFLPLSNVNFFVGENSSGKTSVLKLIKILSDEKFWFTQLFSSDEADLGYYSEITSTSKKKYFEVGILGDESNENEGINAVKFKFINKEGIPVIKELSLIYNDINIQTLIEDDILKYRFEEVKLNNIDKISKIKYFKNWVENVTLAKKKYQEEKEKSFLIKNALIFYVQNIIFRLNENIGHKYNSGIQIPDFLKDIAWLAPIRTEPKRTYDNHNLRFNPDGTHTPYLLNKLLNDDKYDRNKFDHILQKFGLDSGLFDKVAIKKLRKEQTSPFELEIFLNNNKLKITNVGYGVSQILPLIIEIMARKEGTWFAIQQPEIHLHPRGQAAFGDLILKSAVIENKNFIIETHSDFTIDRYRLKMNKFENKEILDNIESQIVFFNKKDGKNTLTCIPINNDGSLSENQPKEFREFFIREQLELLSF